MLKSMNSPISKQAVKIAKLLEMWINESVS